eukprot:332240_1
MSLFKRSIYRFSFISHSPCSIRHFTTPQPTKQYMNLSDEDKELVDELISNAPGFNTGMTSFMTGKGVIDPLLKGKYKELQSTMMKEIAKQLPSTMHRFKFFGNYLKNMTKNLRLMNDTDRKLRQTIKGVAIKYNLIKVSFQGIIFTKTLIDMYGNERTSQILSNTQNVCGPLLAQPMVQYLEENVPHHLRYAVVNGLNKDIIKNSEIDEGIFNIDWIDDDIYSKQFEFHVKRCIFRDIGREFGDTDNGGENNLTYTWFCQFDDKMIPNLGQYADFEFKREGTLGKGCTHCDFKFQHSSL